MFKRSIASATHTILSPRPRLELGEAGTHGRCLRLPSCCWTGNVSRGRIVGIWIVLALAALAALVASTVLRARRYRRRWAQTLTTATPQS
jgi:hypothetical protein